MAKNPPNKKQQPKNSDPSDDDQDEDQEGGEEDEQERDLDSRINSIVTNRLKRFETSISKKIEDGFAKAMAARPSDGDQEGEEEAPAKGKKADPKLSKMERELADAKRALQESKEASEKKDADAKRNEEKSILEQSLMEAGLTDKALRGGALAYLLSEGRMVRDEEGKVKWKGQDKYGQDVLMDPAAGAKAWTKADGKSYLPAIDAGGSGGGPSNGKVPKAQIDKMSPRDRAAEEIRRASLGLPPLE